MRAHADIVGARALLIKKDIEMGLPIYKQSSSNPGNNIPLELLLDQQTQDIISTEK